jgi:1-deoxy-D-xylulose-5-phosphate reductoisomerase
LNGANEGAVELFLGGKIAFRAIPQMAAAALEGYPDVKNPSLEDIIQANAWAREKVLGGLKPN